MSIEESERHLLHERAAQALGVEAAAVLMSHLPPAGCAELARRSDVEHETALLRAELGTLRTELKGDMANLRTELKGHMANLRTELKDDMVTQTRWMISVLTVLAAIFTAVNMLA